MPGLGHRGGDTDGGDADGGDADGAVRPDRLTAVGHRPIVGMAFGPLSSLASVGLAGEGLPGGTIAAREATPRRRRTGDLGATDADTAAR